MLLPMALHDHKSCGAPYFDHTDHMECSGASDSAVGILWCHWSYMTKNNAVHHYHLDSRNVVMSLIMPLASCNANTGAKGVI